MTIHNALTTCCQSVTMATSSGAKHLETNLAARY